MPDADENLVDWEAFGQARSELGAAFVRILGYFREDGVKSVAAIETAMRANDATALVIPAHTLKGEASQFGADPLADLAESIELIARDCIETHQTPDKALELVVQLGGLFEQTLALLERAATPLVERRNTTVAGFGRRAAFGQATR